MNRLSVRAIVSIEGRTHNAECEAMRNDYLPGTRTGLAGWFAGFDKVLMREASRFGVPAADAQAWHAEYLVYAASYREADVPRTRTVVSVTGLRLATENLTRRTREMVAGIQARRTTTDADRAALGITVPRQRRRRVARPGEPPFMWVAEVRGRRMVLKLNDAEAVGVRRRRPAGVKGVQVFRATGERMPSEWSELSVWSLATSTNETKLVLEVEASLEPGSRVWWTARWVNARSEAGPACLPVEARVNSGW